MLDLFIPILSGTLIGFFVGLTPGIGASTMMVLLFPVLIKSDLQSVLIFYCCMTSAAQFGGSVTALALGLPGEQNSYPLIAVRDKLIEDGEQAAALFICAFGHLLGSVIIFAFSWLLIDIIGQQTGYLRIPVMIGLCFLAAVLSLITSSNRWYLTLSMMCFAWFFASIGADHLTGQEFFTFGNIYLSSGLPPMAVITGFFVIPVIYNMFVKRSTTAVARIDTDFSFFSMLRLIKDCLPSMLRGSGIGFFAGLIPYVGIDMSSYIVFYTERLLKNNTLRQIAAAETATNAAAVSVLLPLLIYGIAILVSENLLLEAVKNDGRVLNWSIVQPMFPLIALSLMMTNCLSFLLSWNLAGAAVSFLEKSKQYIPYVMLALCTYSTWQLGHLTGQGNYYLITVAVFGALGMLFRNVDRLPFIMIFLLHDQVSPAIVRFIALYL